MTCSKEYCTHLNTKPPNQPALETENAHHYKRSLEEVEQLLKQWENGTSKITHATIRRMINKSIGLKE